MKSDYRESKEALLLRDLFTELAHGFTKHHDDLTIETNQAANFITLTATAHAEDAAKLIGHGGQNFNALRTILNFAAAKENFRFHLSRVKDKRNSRVPDFQASYQDNPNWPAGAILDAAQSVCNKLFKGPAVADYAPHTRSKSIIEIRVAEDEPFFVPAIQVEECLSAIFAATGNCNGRKLGVRLIQDAKLNQTKSNGTITFSQAACR